jgi:hypothetical protein
MSFKLKKMLLTSVIIFGTTFIMSIYAAGPGGPGSGTGGTGAPTGNPVGGGAPIGGGVIVMLALAAGYGFKKLR